MTAVFKFTDNEGTFAVSSDAIVSPMDAAAALMKALDRSYMLPRYDAAEFACGFIAANKPTPRVVLPAHVGTQPAVVVGGGGLRLLPHNRPWVEEGVEYVYEIVQSTANNYLIVYAYEVSEDGTDSARLFRGPLHHFARQFVVNPMSLVA